MSWGAVNARARGLGTRTPEPALRAALEAPRGQLGRRLAAASPDLAAAVGAPDAPALERVVRRAAGRHLAVLRKWLAPRDAEGSVVLHDEDRRSVRALLRACVAGETPSARRRGLLATPSLPGSALDALGEAATVPELVAKLGRWHAAWSRALEPFAHGDPPDLLALETALDRAFARGALAAARRHGPLRRHVQRLLDATNGLSAVALAGRGGRRATNAFLPGGHLLSRTIFGEAAASSDRAAAASRVARAFGKHPLADAFRGAPIEDLERRVLGAHLRCLKHEARLDPLGPAPWVRHALLLRSLVTDVRARACELELATHGGAVKSP